MTCNESDRRELWRAIGPAQSLSELFAGLVEAAGAHPGVRAAVVLASGDGSLHLAACRWPASALADRLPYRPGSQRFAAPPPTAPAASRQPAGPAGQAGLPANPAALPADPLANPAALPVDPPANPAALPADSPANPAALPADPLANPAALLANPAALPADSPANPAALSADPPANPAALLANPAALPADPLANPAALPADPLANPAALLANPAALPADPLANPAALPADPPANPAALPADPHATAATAPAPPATAAIASGRAAPLVAGRPPLRERVAPGQLERLGQWLESGARLCRWTESTWPEPLAAVFRGTLRDAVVAAAPLPPILRAPAGFVVLVGGPGDAALPSATAHALLDRLLEPCALAVAVDPALRALDDAGPIAPGDHDGLSERVIGAEGGLRFVMERVAIVAAADVPVLILGETGSGKEVIARTIHARSSRAQAPFVRVNCGAIAPELLDSELFGHERGAFTGAEARRRGWFERADTGTLLLDEVGELSAQAQVRLLRVLQDGELVRVGGERPIAVDVRVIAATHRDLYAMVKDKAFREDLWYRLAVFPVHLPPLRDHGEDIPAMAEFFARRAAARFDLPVCLPTAADLDTLGSYPWPGNVRELAAVMDRAVLLGQGRGLAIDTALGRGPQPQQPAAPPAVDTGSGRLASLDAAIRAHIERALAITGGRVDGPRGAARLLGVNPNTLRSRMRRMRIRRLPATPS